MTQTLYSRLYIGYLLFYDDCQDCHRSGKTEKSGENVKKVWNLEICSQFPYAVPIPDNYYNFLIYLMFIVKYVKNCTL